MAPIYKDWLNDMLIALHVLGSDSPGAIHSIYNTNNIQGLVKG